jgi:hypothetical protein
MDVQTIVFICFVLGGLTRTIYAFLSKVVQSSDPVRFDLKFAATLGASVISTIILAAIAFAAFPIPTETPLLYVIIAAVTSGYALNDGINRGVTTLLAVSERNAVGVVP